MPKRLQLSILFIAILSGCTLDNINHYGDRCPPDGIDGELSYIKEPTCTAESCDIGNYAQNFQNKMCPSDVPECARDDNDRYYCATIQCAEDQHIYHGQCEPDDLENCGQHDYSCAKEATGWKDGICQNGKCHATECQAGYMSNSGKCEASECGPGEHSYKGICEEDDINNCGKHSQACHSVISGWLSGECRDGQCFATACDELRGYEIIDGNCRARTGCESGLHYYNGQCEPDDLNNCGNHGNTCSEQPGWVSGACEMVNNQRECHSDEACSGGVCIENECFKTECVASECEDIYEIKAGKCVPRTECDTGSHLYQNQCEPDTVENCGEHNIQCKNIIPGLDEGFCSDKRCVASSCIPGYHLSEETCLQDTPTACGEPPKSCEIGQLCANGTCKDSCDSGTIRCIRQDQTAVCIDPLTDSTYCGANSQCQNYTTCGNGKTCIAGTCTQTSCPDPQDTLCTANQNAYCANIFASDAQNCGSCNYVCAEHPQNHATSSTCSSGKCQYQCEANHTNCGNAEIPNCIHTDNFKTDANNCGSCGHKCNPNNNETCQNGVSVVSSCKNSCLYNNQCINEDAHCGTGCSNCNALPNVAKAHCDSSGSCIIDSCISSAHIYNNTCEPDSPSNCGSHDYTCSEKVPGWNGGSCANHTCKANACTGNYHLYSYTCEQDSDTNCGQHGNTCVNGETCQNKTCKCPNGYTNVIVNGQSVKAACITTKEDFLSFRDAINAGNVWPADNTTKTYTLTRSISLITQGTWTGVGTTTHPFVGTFVGNNNTLSGSLTCSSDNCGIFGYAGKDHLTTTSISDLRSSVTVDSSYKNVGGIVGYATYTTLTNLHSSGSISGSSNVGGIVGNYAPGNITNCSSSGKILASDKIAGGIVGSAAGHQIRDCISTGNVIAAYGEAGGIAGFTNGGSINNSHTTGSTNGAGSSGTYGGIIGKAKDSSIGESYSTSSLSAAGICGGLAGSGNNLIITSSYFNGSINCGNSAGGLVGDALYRTDIQKSGALGNSSGNPAGGLSGYIAENTDNITINNSFAVTSLTGSSKGGLVGKSASKNTNGSTIDCNWVSATFNVTTQSCGAVCYGEKSFTQTKPVFVYKPTYTSAPNKNYVLNDSSTFTLSNYIPVLPSTPMINGLNSNCSDGGWKAMKCSIKYGLADSGTYTLPMPGISPNNCN